MYVWWWVVLVPAFDAVWTLAYSIATAHNACIATNSTPATCVTGKKVRDQFLVSPQVPPSPLTGSVR